jgi:hypothetical protein
LSGRTRDERGTREKSAEEASHVDTKVVPNPIWSKPAVNYRSSKNRQLTDCTKVTRPPRPILLLMMELKSLSAFLQQHCRQLQVDVNGGQTWLNVGVRIDKDGKSDPDNPKYLIDLTQTQTQHLTKILAQSWHYFVETGNLTLILTNGLDFIVFRRTAVEDFTVSETYDKNDPEMSLLTAVLGFSLEDWINRSGKRMEGGEVKAAFNSLFYVEKKWVRPAESEDVVVNALYVKPDAQRLGRLWRPFKRTRL